MYKQIKENVANAQQAIAFSSELESASNLYAALLSSDHEFWTGWGSSTKANIETLIRLSLEQNRPMLLAVLQYFSQKEAQNALRLAVNWSVRGLIGGGIGGGVTEKAYCDAAMAVRSGAIKTANDLLDQLHSIVPTDEEFKTAFAVARVTKPVLARYYLVALEAQLANTQEPELVPNTNEEQVNLEHVLPKNASVADWPSFPDETHKQFVDRLGNHALLPKTRNDKIGNKPFASKRAILSASNFNLTQEVGKSPQWTPAEIVFRQERLAELAVKVWSRQLD